MSTTTKNKGLFITLEGGEGTGKTTVARMLCDRLTSHDFPAECTREPGGTPLGLELRRILLNGDFACSRDTQLLIVNAARVAHWNDVIHPALMLGTHVVCDRFVDSTRVYQGLTQPDSNKALAQVEALHQQFLPDAVPDITFVLDLDPVESLKRVNERGLALNHFDTKPLAFHTAVRNGFLQLTQKGKPYHVVSADAAADEVVEHCWTVISRALSH